MKAAAKRKTSRTVKKASKPAVRTKKIKNPTFHHALLENRPHAGNDRLVCRRLSASNRYFRTPGIAFLSNDGANHRISMVGNPQFLGNPNFRKSVGMHHLAFEYESVDDLLDTWRRLHEEHGYKPHVAVHHGMTLSFYYADPENNSVELQADVFGDWKKSKAWMRTSPQFKADPVGKFVDPRPRCSRRDLPE